MTISEISNAVINHARKGMTSKEKQVIVAASVGTVFEIYDFFLMGLLPTRSRRTSSQA